MPKPNLDHPTLPLIKQRFADIKLLATEFRGQTTLVVPPSSLHGVLSFLRHEPACAYGFLSDIVGIDYLQYPAPPPIASASSNGSPQRGRLAVVYLLVSHEHHRRLTVKTVLNPSADTRGIEHDPALHLPSVCDLWPGAEWPEREVFDMFGIRFDNHPDLRRILTWEQFPAHPLRKDYPLRGRGERQAYRVIQRDTA